MLRKWKVITLLFIFVALVGCVDKEMKVSSDESKEERKAITEKDVFRKLEEEYDTKLGIYALDTGTNQIVSYRAEDRFAYASTHKVLSVGVLLQQNDINKLEEGILIKEDDLVNYNPITEKHVGEQMTWREISDASIRYSDNAAANHILEQIGEPEGFKKALRDIGDDVTNPERIEP